jgi:hypothetical protein
MSSVARAALRVQPEPRPPGLRSLAAGVEVFDLDAAVRSSAVSAQMSLTCHAAWICWSAVPMVLLVTSRWVPLPHPEHDGIFVLSLYELQP